MKLRIVQKDSIGIILLLICFLQVGLSIYFASQKINFHVDEIATYGLANDENGGWLDLPHAQSLSGEDLKAFLSVGEGSRFNYADVWNNQAADVHPPLYYVLVHTFCSIFPSEYLFEVGIAINVILSLLITILLYQIGRNLWTNPRYALLLAAVWAVSFGNLNQTMLIRMYMLLAFLITSLVLLHLHYFDKNKTFRFYLLLIINCILGALTHYYFIVFLFFWSLMYGINLLLKHKWKDVIQYLLTLICSGILALMIFPMMWQHIFSGYRGVESFKNMGHISDILGRLKWFLILISRQMFGGTLFILLGVIAIGMISYIIKHKNPKNVFEFIWSRGQITRLGVMGAACLGYYLMVSKSAIMIVDRYMMPIYPVIMIIMFQIMQEMKKLWCRFQPYYAYAILLFLSVAGLGMQKMDYLYRDSLLGMEYAKKNASIPVIVVCSIDWRTYAVYPELMNYDNIVMITADEVELLKENGMTQYDKLIVYELVSDVEISNNTDQKIDLDAIVEMNEGLSTYQEQFEQYNDTNYITAKVYELD